MTHTPYRPEITTQAELAAAWSFLMGPGGYSGHSLWMMIIRADDRPFPQLVEVTDAAAPPEPDEVGGFQQLLGRIGADLAPGTRFAFLRTRPGGPGLTGEDRAWARVLHDAARGAGVACEPVHLATRGDVRPIPPDELVGLASA